MTQSNGIVTLTDNPFVNQQEVSPKLRYDTEKDPFANAEGGSNLLNLGINAKIDDSTYLKLGAVVVVAVILSAAAYFMLRSMFVKA